MGEVPLYSTCHSVRSSPCTVSIPGKRENALPVRAVISGDDAFVHSFRSEAGPSDPFVCIQSHDRESPDPLAEGSGRPIGGGLQVCASVCTSISKHMP